MKKYKNTIGTVVVFVFMLAAVPLFYSSNSAALECGALPDYICSASEGGSTSDVEGTGVWKLLLLGVNILTAGVAILAIGGIIYSAVLYTSAGGNQDQVKKAKEMLRNVVIGILAFAMMYGLLQWLMPGGVFN